jgi:hypothetical protein
MPTTEERVDELERRLALVEGLAAWAVAAWDKWTATGLGAKIAARIGPRP